MLYSIFPMIQANVLVPKVYQNIEKFCGLWKNLFPSCFFKKFLKRYINWVERKWNVYKKMFKIRPNKSINIQRWLEFRTLSSRPHNLKTDVPFHFMIGRIANLRAYFGIQNMRWKFCNLLFHNSIAETRLAYLRLDNMLGIILPYIAWRTFIDFTWALFESFRSCFFF